MLKFYFKLATNGIRKNKETYLPFFFTFCFIVFAFSSLLNIYYSPSFDQFYGMVHIKTLLFLAILIMGVFSLIILIYSNNYLVKSRQKEFGLFNILGLEKKQIAKIIIIDLALLASGAIFLGLLLATLFFRLAEGLFFRLLDLDSLSGFLPPSQALVFSLLTFLVLTLLLGVFRLVSFYRTSSLDLLKSQEMGEKNGLKTWLLGLLALASLALGYSISLRDGTPLDKLYQFFIAVLFVILGTYAGFHALSSLILGSLMKKKKLYYQSKNFIAFSSLRHRIKQNSRGLASIAIMSTATLILLASSYCVYYSTHRIMDQIFPHEYNLDLTYEGNTEAYEELIDEIQESSQNLLDLSYIASPLILDGGRGQIPDGQEAFSPSWSALYLMDKKILDQGQDQAYFSNAKADLKEVVLANQTISTSQRLEDFPYYKIFESNMVLPSYYVFLDDLASWADPEAGLELHRMMSFDLKDPASYEKIQDLLPEEAEIIEKSAETHGFTSLFAGIYFTGTFLGLIFVLGTGLVIYYKQLSEAYEDEKRYRIYQQVGMSPKEIQATIQRQVKALFLLPPLTAGLHLLVAFKSLNQMLSILGILDTKIKALAFFLTYLVFFALYYLIYQLSSKTYYRIVRRSKKKSR